MASFLEQLKEYAKCHGGNGDCKNCFGDWDCGGSCHDNAKMLLRELDVEEVKHGEWVKEGCGLLVCNKCKFEYAHAGMPDEGLNYCPNCGAKMDGGEAE